MSSVPYAIVNKVLSSNLEHLAVQYNDSGNLTLVPFDPQNIPDNQRWLINPTVETIVVPVLSQDQHAIPNDDFVAAAVQGEPQYWIFDNAHPPPGGAVIKGVGSNTRVWGAEKAEPDSQVTLGPDSDNFAQRWILRPV